MKFLSHTAVTVTELPGELRFLIAHEDGWADLAAILSILLVFTLLVWRDRSWWMLAFPVLMGASYLFTNRNRRPATKLAVTQNELVASDKSDPNPTNATRVAAWELSYLSYFNGEDDEPAGLYAYLDKTKVCLLPNLGQKEVTTITDAIRRKFPLLERGGRSPTSMLHGDDSGITTLGVANPAASQTFTIKKT